MSDPAASGDALAASPAIRLVQPGRRSNGLVYAASVLVGLVAWQLVANRLNGFVFAGPLAVSAKLVALTMSGDIPRALSGSLQHMALGFAIATAIAVPLGMLMGRVRVVHDLCDPVVNLIYAVPSVAFAPLIIVWFGLYFEGRVALVVLMCVFDMLILVDAGARDVDRRLMDVGRSFGASGWQRTWWILLPSSLPFLFTALRIGVVRAVNAMITAELFLAAVNLGSMMKQATVRFDSAGVLAVLVVLCLLGLLLQEVLLVAERAVLGWQGQR